MSNKDFQNGFALGLASGGVVEVIDTTEIDNLEDLIDNSGVLEDAEGTVTEKVEELIDRVYVEYPLPQDDYVYYRYPPCNEDRYIQITTQSFDASAVEYGTLTANGYVKLGTISGVANGYAIAGNGSEYAIYKFTIPAHKQDFIIKLPTMPIYAQSTAECTEVYCGGFNWHNVVVKAGLYQSNSFTINGIKKITINTPVAWNQTYSAFSGLPYETIKFKTIETTNPSNMFNACINLKNLQCEQMILTNPKGLFYQCTSLKTVDCSKIVPSGTCQQMFWGCSFLESLDLSPWATHFPNITNIQSLTRYCHRLKTMNFSGCDLSHLSLLEVFDAPRLENVLLDNATLSSRSFNMSPCSRLTSDSIKAIVNALPTVETAQTLTLNKAIALTDEQKATINAKGWTLAQ